MRVTPYAVRLSRRAAVPGLLLAMAGCAPTRVPFDHSALAGLHRVAVLTPGFPDKPSVHVNGIAANGGLSLPGLLVSSIVHGNRSDALARALAGQSFDPRPEMQTALSTTLLRRGIAAVARPADPARTSPLEHYALDVTEGVDATLDVAVSNYGFLAFSDSDAAPYRPRLVLYARLVGADRSVLLSDEFSFDNIYWNTNAQSASRPKLDFKTFDEVVGDPRAAINALRVAIFYGAGKVVSRLT